MSLSDRLFNALRTAIQLDERVKTLSEKVGTLSHEVHDIDKRLVRIETVVEFGAGRRRGGPPALEDKG